MNFSEIYRRLANGKMVVANTVGAQAAIEKLAQFEDASVETLKLAAPEFSRRYPRLAIPEGMGIGAPSYARWRRTLLDLQMLSAPGNTDSDAWASLRRAARLSGAGQVSNDLSQLPARLPSGMRPGEVTDDVLRKASQSCAGLPAFRQGARAFRKLFKIPLAVSTGLLPSECPDMPPSRHDHHAHAPLSPDLQKLRQQMASGRYAHTLDYINRLAFTGGLLNGRTDRVSDLLDALTRLPDPVAVDVPSVSPGVLRSYRYHVQSATRWLSPDAI